MQLRTLLVHIDTGISNYLRYILTKKNKDENQLVTTPNKVGVFLIFMNLLNLIYILSVNIKIFNKFITIEERKVFVCQERGKKLGSFLTR